MSEFKLNKTNSRAYLTRDNANRAVADHLGPVLVDEVDWVLVNDGGHYRVLVLLRPDQGALTRGLAERGFYVR